MGVIGDWDKFVILGVPRVKKNNQQVGTNRYTGKKYKYDTPSYKSWHKNALDLFEELGFDRHFKIRNKLHKSLGKPLSPAHIDYPINLQCKFYMDTKQAVDLSALYEGIQDVLVEVGILQDDNYKIVASHDGSGVFVDTDKPRMEIVISRKETTQDDNGY